MNGYNFTNRVRRVLANARDEAAKLHHEYVGTEHILLGLLQDDAGVATTVFEELAIDRNEIRRRIEETVKRGKAEPSDPDRSIPYTSRAKKVLELAMTEARGLGHSYVGTEHLLLGLLREEKGIAAQVLTYRGLTYDAARAEVVRVLGPSPQIDAGMLTSNVPASIALEGGSSTSGREWRVGPTQAASVAWQRAFVVFWMTLGIVVLIESIRPLMDAISGSRPVSGLLAVLASAEIVGALLFLFPQTLKFGASILLTVFAIAFVAHLARGELAAPLLVYAAGTFLVLTQRTAR